MSEVTESSVQASTRADTLAEVGALAAKKPRSLWSNAWRQYRRHKLALAGTFVLFFFIVATIVGPMLWDQSPTAIDVVNAMQGPSLQHPMGTDTLGHDVFARILWGGRVSISVGVVAMLVSIFLGTLIGAISGYFGRFIDSTLMRLTDLFLALPTLPLLLLVIYLFRDPMQKTFGILIGMFILIVGIIGVLSWMPVARLVRAEFLSLKEKEFIEAARCMGAGTASIIFRHILPNALSPVIVAATLGVGSAIITESTLSFLGLGFPPDTPTWGRLLYEGQEYIQIAPYLVLFPGLVIFLSVLSINYIGDGLRDAIDPQHTL
ncbi:ABC transporter permease [Sphaerobacter sp.]|uniref:ABC transporter permease n=1 Tax=Sphaerobacter sp. TaxID=2099654 RepID=UPI001DD997DB|nr:ABC transporter permease [Sphaerobacter sp.]MBX5444286.1 ABC transporter permease [Sphaerobacter sp.]